MTRATGQEGSGQEGHDGKQIYRKSFTEDRLTVELLSWMPSVGSWEKVANYSTVKNNIYKTINKKIWKKNNTSFECNRCQLKMSI